MVYFIFYNASPDRPILCVGEWYEEALVKDVVSKCNAETSMHRGGPRSSSVYYYVGVSEDEL